MSTKRVSFAEIFLWILVILLVLVAFTPFALGYKVKSDYTNVVSEMSRVLQLDINIDKYDQGLFSSNSVLSVSLPEISGKILVTNEIIHGPVYFGLLGQGKSPLAAAVVKGELVIPESHEELLSKLFAEDKPLVYQSIIDFSGNVETQSYMPDINISSQSNGSNVSLQMSGMVANDSFNMATGELKGEATIPAIRFSNDTTSIKSEAVSVSFSGALSESGVVMGDSVLSLGLFNIDSGDEQFSLRDLMVRSFTSESSALIDSGANFTVREMLASNQKFGPLKLNLSINGLDAQSVGQLQQIQQQFNQQLEQGIPAEQASGMMMGQMMAILPELIKQAEIKINPLSIDSELGKLEADMDLSLEGIDQNTPADPMFLLGSVNLDFNFSIDEALLKQFISWQIESELQSTSDLQGEMMVLSDEQMEQQVTGGIQAMLAGNWLVMDEGVYFSKITMQQGRLMINDMEVDPMQQLMSGMGGAEPVQ